MTVSPADPAIHPPVRVRRRRSTAASRKIAEVLDQGPVKGAAVAVAIFTVLAPALGGSTALWAQAVLALGAGALLVIAPPVRPPGWVMGGLMAALLAVAGAAFLPLARAGSPAWHAALAAIPGLELPGTLSPQPWLSFEGWGQLLVAVCWAVGIAGVAWNDTSRGVALRIFGGGVIALAGVSLLCALVKWRLPFWPEVGNSPIQFGFFPNRNQTANVLALGGIMVSALGSEDIRDKKPGAWLWFGGLGLIFVALTVAYSRAGIILFFGGLSLWALCSARMAGSPKVASLVVTSGALLLALFFLFGGSTLERFHAEPGLSVSPGKDFRMALFADAWRVAREAPWLGHGLGNFEPIFALARQYSAMPNRPIHPESDWLWLAIEAGWVAPVLVLGLLGVWAWRCFPLARGPMPRLRCAAGLCVLCFAAHGLVDVSGHRFGSLWPALFLAGIALGPPRGFEEPSRFRGAGWRLAGLLPLGFGLFWLLSYQRPLPTSATAARLAEQVENAPFHTKSRETIELATAALRLTPLDWNLYFQRGLALAVARDRAGAMRDLAVARALEPNWSDFCYTSGVVWLELHEPELALESWRQVIVRPGEDSAGLYRQMLELTVKRFPMREELRAWAREKTTFLLQFLSVATPLEFELEAGRLLDEDPKLARLEARERTELFTLWSQRDPAGFTAEMSRHPDWLGDGWLLLARAEAAQGQYREALQLAQRFGPKPPLPNLQEGRPLATLEREFFLNRGDLLKGLALYRAQRLAGKNQDALETVRKLGALSSPPYYLQELESELEGELGHWEQAWVAWQTYQAAQARAVPVRKTDLNADAQAFIPVSGDD